MSGAAPLTAYQRRLFLFLSIACFFEGYDYFAVAQVLPNLRTSLGLTPREAGWLLAASNCGTILAALLVHRADVWGRRRVLTLTIAGYTLASLASGLAPNAWWFGAAQLASRLFLTAEWAVAAVYAAEEFPAARRGQVIGVIQAVASLGAIVCAGVTPLLLKTGPGWRSVFLVGTVPLCIIAYGRRGLRETARFAAGAVAGAAHGGLLPPMPQPRGRTLLLALLWGLTYLCTQSAILFWKEFAVAERGFSDAQVGQCLTIAALAAMPLTFLAGEVLDRIGRRPGAVLIYSAAMVGVWGSYQLHSQAALTAALVLAILGTTAVLPVLSAYTAELFPTARRGAAFAWSNHLLGRLGFVAAPLLVGELAHRRGFGFAVSLTPLSLGAALVLLCALLPETGRRELEETAGA